MIPKKEVVAKRFCAREHVNGFVNFTFTLAGTAPGAIFGLPVASMLNGGTYSAEYAPFIMGVMGAGAVISNITSNWIWNRKYLNETVYAGKVVDPETVKKHLTWKGRIALLPYVGKFVDPRNILSKDAPYSFVQYASDRKESLELDIAKDPMISWDALMQAELGEPVEEALDNPKKLEEMKVA